MSLIISYVVSTLSCGASTHECDINLSNLKILMCPQIKKLYIHVIAQKVVYATIQQKKVVYATFPSTSSDQLICHVLPYILYKFVLKFNSENLRVTTSQPTNLTS